jgi:uncharacterized protein (TIGR03435 family)
MVRIAGLPVVGISGVMEPNFERRIQTTMSGGIVLRLTFGRIEAAAIAGMAALGVCIIAGISSALPIQAQRQSALAANSRFDVASIKPSSGCEETAGGPRLGIGTSPGRLSIKCQTVDVLVRVSYLATGRDPLFISPETYNQEIKGSPAWIKSDRYTIDAKADGSQTRETMLGPMMQTLLEDRFKLKVHRESKEVPVYELTVTKGGSKLKASTEAGCVAFDADKELSLPQGKHFCGVLIRSVNPSIPTALYGATMADLSRGLTRLVGREVIDKTGIAGVFDIRLDLSRADLFPLARMAPHDGDAPASATDPSGSSIFTAMQKLGLKLEAAKGTGHFLVIDHIERPSAD